MQLQGDWKTESREGPGRFRGELTDYGEAKKEKERGAGDCDVCFMRTYVTNHDGGTLLLPLGHWFQEAVKRLNPVCLDQLPAAQK